MTDSLEAQLNQHYPFVATEYNHSKESITFSGQSSSAPTVADSGTSVEGSVNGYNHPLDSTSAEMQFRRTQFEQPRFAPVSELIREDYSSETNSSLLHQTPFEQEQNSSYSLGTGELPVSQAQDGLPFITNPSQTTTFATNYKPQFDTFENPNDISLMAPSQRTNHSYASARDYYAGSIPAFAPRTHAPPAPYSRAPQSYAQTSSSSSGSPGSRDTPSNIANTDEQPIFMELELVPGVVIRGSGVTMNAEIFAKNERSFFMSEDTHDWTCYRRNYFQVRCSFSLAPAWRLGPYDVEVGGTVYPIVNFAMCLKCVIDNAHGKEIDIIQHTPKRDKGPQTKPAMTPLLPQQQQGYGNGCQNMGMRSQYSQAYEPPQGNLATEVTYERLQFKAATQNNGKRRAAQQYYYILAELFADIGADFGAGRYVKIGHRMSEKLVVRGRSPGHYQDNKKENSNAGDVFAPYNRPAADINEPSHGLPGYAYSHDAGFVSGHFDPRASQVMDYNRVWSPNYQDRAPQQPSMSYEDNSYRSIDTGRDNMGYHHFNSEPTSAHTPAPMSMLPMSSSGPYTPGSTYMPTNTNNSSSYGGMSPPSVNRTDRSLSFTSAASLPQPPTPHDLGLPTLPSQSFLEDVEDGPRKRLRVDRPDEYNHRALPPLPSMQSTLPVFSQFPSYKTDDRSNNMYSSREGSKEHQYPTSLYNPSYQNGV